jgi:hypothetical protein
MGPKVGIAPLAKGKGYAAKNTDVVPALVAATQRLCGKLKFWLGAGNKSRHDTRHFRRRQFIP